ncbi:hypothetical protein ABK040_010061 [Willaertia magna]
MLKSVLKSCGRVRRSQQLLFGKKAVSSRFFTISSIYRNNEDKSTTSGSSNIDDLFSSSDEVTEIFRTLTSSYEDNKLSETLKKNLKKQPNEESSFIKNILEGDNILDKLSEENVDTTDSSDINTKVDLSDDSFLRYLDASDPEENFATFKSFFEDPRVDNTNNAPDELPSSFPSVKRVRSMLPLTVVKNLNSRTKSLISKLEKGSNEVEEQFLKLDSVNPIDFKLMVKSFSKDIKERIEDKDFNNLNEAAKNVVADVYANLGDLDKYKNCNTNVVALVNYLNHLIELRTSFDRLKDFYKSCPEEVKSQDDLIYRLLEKEEFINELDNFDPLLIVDNKEDEGLIKDTEDDFDANLLLKIDPTSYIDHESVPGLRCAYNPPLPKFDV